VITKRLLRVLKDAGTGISPRDVSDWGDALNLAVCSGALRLGEQNLKLVDGVLTAWTSKPFTALPATEYTHGDRALTWLDEIVFSARAASALYYIRLPLGHPIKAEYARGRVQSVHALQLPGDYAIDVTGTLARVFPAGIDDKVTAVYAVLSARETSWSRRSLFTGDLILGRRGFSGDLDQLTLSWVDGQDITEFVDFGVLGALEVPPFDYAIETDAPSRGVLIAVADGYRLAMYHEPLRGEILSVQAAPGAGSVDLLRVELDSGVDVCVSDILALRGCAEGTEVCCAYVGDECVLSDEYGNFILGALPERL
jgi:hypothetical protein